MKKNLLLVAITTILSVAGLSAQAQRIELGVGAGKTHPIGGSDFKDASTSGDANQYWIGYGFDRNWGIELGYDSYDFDKINSKHTAINLTGIYRFMADSWIHPITKFGLASIESKNIVDDKVTAIGAKLAAGVEADFKYVSVGGLLSYLYDTKITNDAPGSSAIKDAQALIPALFITIHNAVDYEGHSESVAPVAEKKAEAAPVAAAVAAPAPAKDTDGDGVSDEDDKCPNTPAGVAVNKFGCAEKEKASVKLNVEFASGKATLDPKFDDELNTLVNFMKKFPETKVVIEGHSDNVGAAKLNTNLSQKRANAVKDYLVKNGIEASRVSAKGYGPSRPVADNKTAEGRQANRRVMAEISVITDKKK